MIADEGSRNLKNGVFWGLRKLLSVLYPIIKRASEIHGRRSVNHLIKKHPNQGIHTEEKLSKEDIKKITKDLCKLKIDYAIKGNLEETDKFDITVLSGNKSVIKMLRKANEPPQKDEVDKDNKQSTKKKPSLTETAFTFEE